MRCQSCGSELEEGVLFCGECGKSVQAMKNRFCRACGAVVADEAQFCSLCGAHIDSTLKNTSEEKKTEPSSNHLTFKSSTIRVSSKLSLIVSWTVVFVLFIICITLIGRGGTSNTKSASDDPINETNTAEESSPIITDNIIKKGTEYAYMTGEGDVYIATALSDSLIKIENWSKTLISEKAVKHAYDVGTLKINDPENEFQWIDDDHTAFSIKITDKNISGFRKGNIATFTINVNSNNENKGSDYNKEIACYSYVNDDWHLYRAVSLTPSLIKIEMWQRALATNLSPYIFGRDICVINTNNTDTDFEWTDDERSCFTITMCDLENKAYWKKETLVAFALENQEYIYPDVKTYLEKRDITVTDSRPQKNGFNSLTNEVYYYSQYSIEIPSYWTDEKVLEEGVQRFAEAGNKVAILQIEAGYDTDEDYPVTFDGLMADLDNMQKLIESTVFSEVKSCEIIDTGYVKGVLFTGYASDFRGLGHGFSGGWFTYASEKDRFWCNLVSGQTDNTDYLYDDDFMKMIYSIRPIDGETVEDLTLESTIEVVVETTIAGALDTAG